VTRQAADAARLDRPELATVCVTDLHVANLLDDIEHHIQSSTALAPSIATLTPEDQQGEQRLREQAARQGARLPLEQLALSAFEQEALVLCAAAEIDRRYERIFAYIHDDPRRIHPTIELAASLSARSLADQIERRLHLGRFGRLRRAGLIETFGDSTTELRTNLRLAAGVLEFLTGAASLAESWRDPAEISSTVEEPSARETGSCARLARALAERTVNLIGLWGRSAADAGLAVAQLADMPARQLLLDGPPPRTQVLASAALGAVLLVNVDSFANPERAAFVDQLVDALASSGVPCILTGAAPWRPTALLARRQYAELELGAADIATRAAEWRLRLPEADARRLDDLAGRFHLSSQEVRAAANLARLQARIDSNGTPIRVEDRLDAACAAVTRKHAGKLLQLVRPRRTPNDLILAPELHRHVLEISRFTRALPRVSETWGFGQRGNGASGIKALFTGDPGTGKTLAAEVIAGMLNVSLLKINIAQTVSKWLGETSKNLDEAFDEAEASHAVLFIDEADALCGKRGEVRHGVDRYANIEVSHLLQRLESHNGLVILASNLKENIDPAFLRRFHVVVNFPRPAEPERRRLWQHAFPPAAPLAADVDLNALARFDMTGAGIVGAARTAALLAAERIPEAIRMLDVVQGVVRQYRREGRMLTRGELGAYAALVQET